MSLHKNPYSKATQLIVRHDGSLFMFTRQSTAGAQP